MSSASSLYGQEFYALVSDESVRSARAATPLIVEMLAPRSVVDVGCGRGAWLAAMRTCGVADVLGIDGDYVNRSDLYFPAESFRSADLARPLKLDRRFDVALCLEVAEHLPASAAARLVASLVALAPAVLFSAAVPCQGGIGHLNEQWPWYWKDLFASCGYLQLDPFRRSLWGNHAVASYYQQNTFLYVAPSVHQPLIDRIGVPNKFQEMTLVRTCILQELLCPPPSLPTRVFRRLRSMLLGSRARS